MPPRVTGHVADLLQLVIQIRTASLLLAVAGCSFSYGKPSSHGWPSSNPDDYASRKTLPCDVYRTTTPVDLLVTIVSSAVALTGRYLVDETGAGPMEIGGAALAIPFLLSTVTGFVGQTRCLRWGRSFPFGYDLW